MKLIISGHTFKIHVLVLISFDPYLIKITEQHHVWFSAKYEVKKNTKVSDATGLFCGLANAQSIPLFGFSAKCEIKTTRVSDALGLSCGLANAQPPGSDKIPKPITLVLNPTDVSEMGTAGIDCKNGSILSGGLYKGTEHCFYEGSATFIADACDFMCYFFLK